MQLGDNRRQKRKQIADKDKPVVDHKKHKACRRKYTREYMKARQADDNLRKNENKKTVQDCNIDSKTSRTKKH